MSIIFIRPFFRLGLIGALGIIMGCAALRPVQRTTTAPEYRDLPLGGPADEGVRHRVLVLPFLDENLNRSEEASKVARETFLKELAYSGQFIVVALSDFPQDPKEFIKEKQEYDLTRVARIAAPLGVAAVIEGKLLDLNAKKLGDAVGVFRKEKALVESNVRIRVVAGKSGREIFNQSAQARREAFATQVGTRSNLRADDPELVIESTRQAYLSLLPGVKAAIEKLNWEGRVAMVTGERIYINAGRLSGLQVGDILKITEEGNDVFDPETGRFIGVAPGRLKGTVEVISYFGKDGAVSVIHSGHGFRENDLVQLY